MTMRLSIVMHTDSPKGGVSSVFLNDVARLTADGVEVLPILKDESFGDDSLHHRLECQGIRSELVYFRWWCGRPEAIRKAPWLPLRAEQINWLAERRVKTLLEEWKPTLLLVFDSVTGMGYRSAQRLGIPSVGYLQEVPTVGHGLRFYSTRQVRRTLRIPRRLVAISPYVRDGWSDLVDPARVTVVPNGVDETHVFWDERPYAPDGVVRMTLAGSVVPAKGQLLLVQAVERLLAEGRDNLDVRLYGADEKDPSPYQREVAERIASGPARGKVRLLPYETNVSRVWANTDVVVSCSDAEGFGLALAEGMASGCTAVGPRSGAVPDLLGEGRGQLYEPGDPTSLARALALAADGLGPNPQTLAYARGLTVDNHYEQLMQVLREAEDSTKEDARI